LHHNFHWIYTCFHQSAALCPPESKECYELVHSLCLWNAYYPAICNAMSAGDQAAKRSRLFAPPGVYLPDHFMVM
jgi:hypothetical protein